MSDWLDLKSSESQDSRRPGPSILYLRVHVKAYPSPTFASPEAHCRTPHSCNRAACVFSVWWVFQCCGPGGDVVTSIEHLSYRNFIRMSSVGIVEPHYTQLLNNHTV
jgi:hypothetical protein